MTQLKPFLIALLMTFALLATAIVPTANVQESGFQNSHIQNVATKPSEPSVAVTIWREAAKRGDSSAQFMLGLYNAKGKGMPRNMLKAYVWLKLSAPTYPLSKALLKHVTAELSPSKKSIGDFWCKNGKPRKRVNRPFYLQAYVPPPDPAMREYHRSSSALCRSPQTSV